MREPLPEDFQSCPGRGTDGRLGIDRNLFFVAQEYVAGETLKCLARSATTLSRNLGTKLGSPRAIRGSSPLGRGGFRLLPNALVRTFSGVRLRGAL
jgi:hypothetical protein